MLRILAMNDVPSLCRRARAASRLLAPHDRASKDAALRLVAEGLRARTAEIVSASAKDVEEARARGTSGALLDRLALDAGRVEQMADAVDQVATLDDPVGQVLSDVTRPSGIHIRRVRVPLGVVAMIYEARPNVTAEASRAVPQGGQRGGPPGRFGGCSFERGDRRHPGRRAREGAGCRAMRCRWCRPATATPSAFSSSRRTPSTWSSRAGGEALITFVRENARVPVIAHASGVCHLYVDAGADVEMATRLAVNGKLQRPGVCNAIECLLVDARDAGRLLPPIARALLDGGCELRGDDAARALVPEARVAAEADWGREYLDRILAVRVVDGIEGALEHVARYGSRHTEAICTRDEGRAARWRREVDAACVVVNASTRFHDGGEFGLGAEIGIATSKLHWRGAMGLEALTTFQWVVEGAGQTR